MHVQAVGDFPSEPIWLDAGTVSTAPSRNNSAGVISTASTDGGHQHPQSIDASNKRNTKAPAAAAKAAGCVLREAGAGGSVPQAALALRLHLSALPGDEWHSVFTLPAGLSFERGERAQGCLL